MDRLRRRIRPETGYFPLITANNSDSHTSSATTTALLTLKQNSKRTKTN